MRRNPFVRIGRPPMAGVNKRSRLGTPPLSPMQGFSGAMPATSFAGGGTPSYHDDPKLSRSHSEHGHQSFQQMCKGGRIK